MCEVVIYPQDTVLGLLVTNVFTGCGCPYVEVPSEVQRCLNGQLERSNMNSSTLQRDVALTENCTTLCYYYRMPSADLDGSVRAERSD